jgi:hypothetical protein
MNWKLTQAAIGKPQVDDWSDKDHEEDLSVGYSLIRALAADYQLTEIGPGVWRQNSGEGAVWIPKDGPGWEI